MRSFARASCAIADARPVHTRAHLCSLPCTRGVVQVLKGRERVPSAGGGVERVERVARRASGECGDVLAACACVARTRGELLRELERSRPASLGPPFEECARVGAESGRV